MTKNKRKDNFQKYIIIYYKKILNRLELIHRGSIKYKLYYGYINHLLKDDFKSTDESFKNHKINYLSENIPYKFWIMWWQGIDKAPILVKKNMNYLKRLFGKENVIFISKDNYKKYTNISSELENKLETKQISFVTWSDIVRFNLLKNNGGYWIDSTVVISAKFKDYFSNISKKNFFTICNSMDQNNYRNISYSNWTLWFLGGIPNLNFFTYMNRFYEIYFSRHNESIDYFLTDDAIAHYFSKQKYFRDCCKLYNRNWFPYYWLSNFTSTYGPEIMERFNNELDYSVQKITYKFPKEFLNNKNNLISYLLRKKNWDI